MSELDSKLKPAEKSSGTKARATFGHLEKRRGFEKAGTDEVVIRSMGNWEHWVRISGRGKDAVYELDEFGKAHA